jgi:maltooligosyltrehalose trehalohydrolase
VLTGERAGYYRDFGTIADLAKAFKRGFVYDGKYSDFRGRRHGRPLGNIPLSRLLGSMQNHDQIGNRDRGDRMHQITSLERVKIGAALMLASPFVPLLFQGEEWAASSPFQYFTNHEDPDVGRAVSEGRRREFVHFGWDPQRVPDPQDPDTFLRSKLNWSERKQEPHAGMQEWYRRLIELRRQVPDLRSADTGVTYSESEGWLVLHRGSVSVACNFSAATRPIPMPGGHVLMLASSAHVECRDGALVLPPDSVAVTGRTAVGEERSARGEELATTHP